MYIVERIGTKEVSMHVSHIVQAGWHQSYCVDNTICHGRQNEEKEGMSVNFQKYVSYQCGKRYEIYAIIYSVKIELGSTGHQMGNQEGGI